MKCPVCKKDVVWEGNPFRPFCSERCTLMDLGNWASEKYSVPTENEAFNREWPIPEGKPEES